jgi:diguanylate cyclase (GGDEF)-like protein
VARYGGEELAVVLPLTDQAGATVVAQMMLDRLEQNAIVHRSSPFGRVTVSIGIACASGAEMDGWQSLLDKADAALYSAKRLGRNRLQAD